MANQRQWRAGSAEDWLNEPDLIPQSDNAVRRPFRTLAGSVQIRSQNLKSWRQKTPKRLPLPRAARVRVCADDAAARAGLTARRAPGADRFRRQPRASGYDRPGHRRARSPSTDAWRPCTSDHTGRRAPADEYRL